MLLLRSDHAYDVRLTDIADTWADAPAWRRLLAGEVIARLTAADTQALDAVQQHQLALFPPEDSIYWARQAAGDPTGNLAAMLPLPYPGESPELDSACATGAHRIRNWKRSPPAGSHHRQLGSRKLAQKAAERSTQVNGELERLAAERPTADDIRPWWGTIVQWLARDPEKFHKHPVSVHLDLTVAPSCPPPGSPLRAALQAAALAPRSGKRPS